MKAIILAAGYATRLYPLTLNTPKPLLKVGKKLMVEHIIAKIDEVSAIDEIFIVTNDKFYQQFVDWSGKFRSKKKVVIINDGTKTNEDRLGAVGDIAFVMQKHNIMEDTMVIAGDNLFEFSLADFFKFFKEKKASAVALRDLFTKEAVAGKFGVILLDKNKRIIDFEEKPAEPKSTFASTACYIFTKEDVGELDRCIKENRKPDNSGDFIKYLSSKKPVYGYVFKERWFDIGSHEQYEEVNKIYR